METQAAAKRSFRQILTCAAVVLSFAMVGCSDPGDPLPQQPRTLEPFEETLANVSETLAKDASLIVGGRGDVVFANGRLLYRPEPSASFTLRVFERSAANVITVSDEKTRQQLSAIVGEEQLSPAAWTVEGMTEGGDAVVWARGAVRVSVPLNGPGALQLPEEPCGPPKLISDQFPTTFGPLYERRAPSTCRFLTTSGGNLFIRSDLSEAAQVLTTTGTDQLLWGGSEESGPELNAFWSPDEQWVAAILLDERTVPREPVMHYLNTPPTVDFVPYPRSGEPLQRFNVHALKVDGSERIAFDLPDTTDHYVNILGWNATGTAFFVQVIDRDHSSIDILAADLSDRAFRKVIRLESETYIDTLYTVGPPVAYPYPGSDGPFGDGLLYLSEETGKRQLFVTSADGRSHEQLSEGHGVIHQILSIDEKFVFALAAADPDRPYDHHLIKIALDGSGTERLSPEVGHHRVRLAPDGESFVAVRSTVTDAPLVEWRDDQGALLHLVDEVDPSQLVADGYGGPEEIWHKTASGERQRGVLLKPFHFDPDQSYPVVEIVYGGMQVVHTPRDFYGFGQLRQGYNADPAKLLLRNGFAVFYVDAPGTPERGRAFQDATYGTWPQGVMTNHADWLRAVADDRPWLDLDRVGIYGNSWGGYLATRALIDEPSLYKAAVAMAAPQDFVDHPMYIEPFMGRPADNPDGYAEGSNLRYVEHIDSPLLVISYPLDVNAGFSPSMKLIRSMMDHGKEVEFFMVPGINHRITCCGDEDAHYVYTKMTRFLREELASPD
ncbi:MAG: DPP IV N-terminal domain-containing protein [Pseudomonadota bacterium]